MQRFFFGFLVGGVRGVAFLPEEFRRPQKQARAHFPANDIRPLIDQQRQVAVGLNPVAVGIPDDRFGRRPHNQRLFQLLPAGVRHDRHFGSEAFDVLGFLLQKALGNEHREIGVLMSGFLEHAVERLLHLFPDGIAVGTNDHAALDGRVVGQFSGGNNVGVPAGIVVRCAS